MVYDVIANRIAQKGDSFAANVYRSGTEVIDAVPSYVVGGPILSSIRSAAESATEKLKKEKASGASDKEAVTRAFEKGVREAAVDVGAEEFFGERYIKDAKGKDVLKNIQNRLLETSLKSVAKNRDVYRGIVEEYKKQGFSDKHAKNIAVYEMMKTSGSDALKDVALDAAQKKFVVALERKLSLKH